MTLTITTPNKIIIADDHPLFRQALLTTLTLKFKQTQWFEAQTIAELEQQLNQHNDCDLVLLDLHIPEAHGFNTLLYIRSHFPQIPVVIVSAHEKNDIISKALELGAVGFIPKSTPVDDIFSAIQHVLLGNIWTPSHYAESSMINNTNNHQDIAKRVSSLTKQQYKILMMFAKGLLNKQIAYDLNVSEATIKAHATAIFRKLKVNNRTQAVIALSQLDIAEIQIED